jgi:hypothetical protein
MRTRSLVGVATLVLLALIFSLSLYVAHIGRVFGECRLVQLLKVPSPNGSKSVVAYRKECGSTVPDSTQASIVSTGNSFSPERAPPFVISGHQDILATWSGEQVVRIGLIPGVNRVYKRDESAGDIRIQYE